MGQRRINSRLLNCRVKPTSPNIRDYPDALSLYERESLAAEAVLAAERKKRKIDAALNRIAENTMTQDDLEIATLKTLWLEEEGQDIAEYAVMVAVILVLVIGTVRLIGTNANNAFNSVGSSLSQ